MVPFWPSPDSALRPTFGAANCTHQAEKFTPHSESLKPQLCSSKSHKSSIQKIISDKATYKSHPTPMVTNEQRPTLSSLMIIMILDRVAAMPLPRHRYGDERTTLYYFLNDFCSTQKTPRAASASFEPSNGSLNGPCSFSSSSSFWHL